jgi:hypothetical protein
MNMKRHITSFIRDLDAFCARLNDGLTAVAILLGFMVMTMSVIRAQEFFPQTLAMTPVVDYQIPLGN